MARSARMRPPALLILGLGLLAACGRDREPYRLPPFPEADVAVEVPQIPGGPALWLRAEVLDPAGEAAVTCLAVSPEGGLWRGMSTPAGRLVGQYVARGFPKSTATESRRVPAGNLGFAGDLGLLLTGVAPQVNRFLEGIQSAPLEMALGSLPEPGSELEAYLLATGISLVELLREAAPGLVRSPVQGFLVQSFHGGVFDLLATPTVPWSAPEWREDWYPPAPPRGVGMTRLSLPAGRVFPKLESWLDHFGFAPPPPPRVDFALEVHLLQLDAGVGLALAMPRDWLPVEPGELEWLELGASGGLPGMIPAGLLDEARAFVSGDASFLTLGPAGFADELEAALQSARPKPYAERRHGWPRASFGALLDVRAFSRAMRTVSPFPIPTFGGDSSQEQVVELVAGEEDGALRLRVRWPAMPKDVGGIRMSPESFGIDGRRFLTEQMMGSLLESVIWEPIGGLQEDGRMRHLLPGEVDGSGLVPYGLTPEPSED